jgi:hypothetical protein
MAWHPVTREIYDLLVVAFRERPGQFSHAARHAGVEARMAKRGWFNGWPKDATWAKPIKLVLEEENDSARAEMLKQAEADRAAAQKERDLSRQEGVERRTQMLQLAKAMRGTLGAGVVALQKIGPVLAKALDSFSADLKVIEEMHPREKLVLAREYIKAHSILTSAYAELDAIARLEENKPTEIVQIQAEDMTPEQAAREIEEAKALLDLAREEGLLGEGSGNGHGGVGGNGSNGKRLQS